METIPTIAFTGGALCVASVLAHRATVDWFDPEANDAQPVTQGGRQAAWFVQGVFGQGVLRHYRRGGLRAKFGREHYLWMGAAHTRSFAEFRVLLHLQARGVAVPQPLAAAYWRRGLFYRAAILLERIAGACTLAIAQERTDPNAVAQAIFAMHEAGVWHADLNAHNILLDPEGRIWLIDFDRARIGVVSKAQRHKNLLRLRRSLVKVCGAPGALWWDGLDAAYERLMR
ncbi:3-deoxy-D-manno-octulosonic acid kinase [Alcaligenaceae bacterium CGII-47]|nr:3-deoxy-D-manno-octulosonic acid kinase [Alcaligenaceae bacterium CGII-47]